MSYNPSSTQHRSLQLVQAGDSVSIQISARRTQKGEKCVFYTAKKVFQHKGEDTKQNSDLFTYHPIVLTFPIVRPDSWVRADVRLP